MLALAYLKRITLETLGLQEITYDDDDDDAAADDADADSDEDTPRTHHEPSLPQYGYRAILQLAEAKTQIAQLQDLCEEQQKMNTTLQVSPPLPSPRSHAPCAPR